MAFLKVLRGSEPGQVLEIEGDRTVIGRHPNCQIVLEDAAVSRHHAQVLESHGKFYIEDLHSRNKTFLNETQVQGRCELKNTDTVRICSVVFQFSVLVPDEPRSGETMRASKPGDSTDYAKRFQRKKKKNHPGDSKQAAPPLSQTQHDDNDSDLPVAQVKLTSENDSQSPVDKSSIIDRLDMKSSNRLRLNMRAEARLRALLNITAALGKRVKVDEVLSELLNQLFAMFPQAAFGVVLLRGDDDPNEMRVHSTRTAFPEQEARMVCSQTMVRLAIESGEAILSEDSSNDGSLEDAKSVSEFKIKSMMCVPLFDQDKQPLGAIQIISQSLHQQFNKSDLELFANVGVQATFAVENAQLHEEVIERRATQKELEVATQIQHGFLPSTQPSVPGYLFSDYYEPAQSIGGDYFDYIPLPDGRIAIAIADVAGKGIPAAMLMARLSSATRFQLLTNVQPAAAMRGLNHEIAIGGLGFRFITFAVVFLDVRCSEITVCNAGHLPPLLRSASGDVMKVGEKLSSMPLGIEPDQEFHELTMAIRPGESVLLMTDGVTEAQNPQEELYGVPRATRFFERFSGQPNELIDAIVTDVERYSEGHPQSDDMCLVAFQREADSPGDASHGGQPATDRPESGPPRTFRKRNPLDESTTLTDDDMAAQPDDDEPPQITVRPGGLTPSAFDRESSQ